MSNKKVETKKVVEEVEEVKVETKQALSFEEMQKSVAEFKRLQKLIKQLSKEDRVKLLPPVHKREIPESLVNLAETIFETINKDVKAIREILSSSVTTDKPDGNKSISLSIDECEFSIAIIRKSKKEKK